jgi:hypothetical protein
MHASVYLPLVIAGLFGLTAPRLALRLPLGSRSSGRRNRSTARRSGAVVERWADEDAAATCDRRSVALALTGIATGTGAARQSGVILAAAANDVQSRVRALARPD